jgi:leucyl aminopeptidase
MLTISFSESKEIAKHRIIITNLEIKELVNKVSEVFNENLIESAQFEGFEGKTKQELTLNVPGKKYTFFWVEPKKLKTDFQATIVNWAHKNWDRLSEISIHILTNDAFENEDIAETFSYAFLLGSYKIGKFKTTSDAKKAAETNRSLHWVHPKTKNLEIAINKGLQTAETYLQIFDLVNAPGNKKTPQHITDWALNSSKNFGYKVAVLEKDELIKQGFGALLAVNRGSEVPAKMLLLSYKHPEFKGKKVGLVGKGVTFDTGGISIKGSNNMHLMKSDMGGAAAVLGVFELAARLNLKANLVGAVPLTDNSVDSLSIKPGDVIDSYSGKSIEIIDTDAEGRLILADGLSYLVKNEQPDILIDLATLTGSAVQTFGYHCGALFSSNENLIKDLQSAGQKVNENVWPLPIWDVYTEDIESDVADVKNYSGKPVAGAISAAKFLEFFTDNHSAWAHLDIAGVAFGSGIFGKERHAKGFGINLITRFLEDLDS